MRLEINAFFMHKQDTDSFCRSFEDMTDQAEFVANSFEAVRNDLCDISGGVGCLQGALDELEARIREEKTVVENLTDLNRQAEDYVDLVQDTDSAVAKLIHKEKDKFYEVNPWAVPPEPETDERSLLERGWDALCDFAGDVVDTVCEVFNDTIEFISDVGNAFFDLCREGIELLRDIGEIAIELGEIAVETFIHGCEEAWDWIVEHSRAIAEIAIGVVIIAGLAVATICTGGLAAAIFAGALIGAVSFGAIGAISGGISAAAQGQDVFDGVAKGFMGGTISGAVTGAVFVATKGADLNPLVNGGISAGCSAVTETIHAFLDDGQIDDGEVGDIVSSTVISGITGAAFSPVGDWINGKIPGGTEWLANLADKGFEKFIGKGLEQIGKEAGREIFNSTSKQFIGNLFGETLSEGFGNLMGDLIDHFGGGLISEGIQFVIDHPESVVIGNLPSLLPPLQPISPITPHLDIDLGIDIDIDVDLDITFDFRPFCFTPPVVTGPIISAVLN